MTNNQLADADFRRLLLRDILTAHKLTHATIAGEVGVNAQTVSAWASWGARDAVPKRVIAELVRRYPTPWSRRQLQAAA